MAPPTYDEKFGIQSAPAFEINPHRLRKQVIYFTVTAQIVNLAMETLVPYIKRRAFKKVKDYRAGQTQYLADPPGEKPFLTQARAESELGVYNVNDDLREMCMQFGYLCLFSPVWPLTAVSFLVNAWVEMRSDAIKLCVEMRRPVPHRADSIGPWLDSLGFLTWVGSISSAALVYLFSSPNPQVFTGAGLLAAIIFSEHVYFVACLVVRVALSKLDSPGLIKERQERFLVRKRFLQESLGVDEETEAGQLAEKAELEIGHADEEFWGGQEGRQGAVLAGKRIIEGVKKQE